MTVVNIEQIVFFIIINVHLAETWKMKRWENRSVPQNSNALGTYNSQFWL